MIDYIAIVGLGSIGRRHLRLVREFRPGIKIVAVRSGEGKAVPEENIADEIVHTVEDAIEAGIQAAVIATPAVYHAEQAKQLIQNGIHVLVEKPLSNAMVHVNELVELQKKFNVSGLVGYCLRYDPAALKFLEMLNNKKTGQILNVTVDCGSYLPNWRPEQDYLQSVSAKHDLGGGVLLELSHELDYIRWFFGEMENVYANITNSGKLDIDVEDSVDMIFYSLQGFTIAVHLDFNTHSIRRTCIARCTKGDLIWDAVSQKVKWQPVDGADEVLNFPGERNAIYRYQLQHFFDCIKKNKEPAVTFEDGAKVLRMVEAARESNSLGKKVSLV